MNKQNAWPLRDLGKMKTVENQNINIQQTLFYYHLVLLFFINKTVSSFIKLVLFSFSFSFVFSLGYVR